MGIVSHNMIPFLVLVAVLRECFATDCIPPLVHDNTRVFRRYTAYEEDTYEPGVTLKFQCKTPSFTFPTPPTLARRCQEDGTWTGEPLVCNPSGKPLAYPNNDLDQTSNLNAETVVNCPHPGTPEGGAIEEFEKDFYVAYRCIDGYQLEGQPIRKCDKTTGQYDKEMPKCVPVS